MADIENYSQGQIAQLLSTSGAFSGMPQALALRVAEQMAMAAFEVGGTLTVEGRPNHGQLMLIVSGDVRISSQLAGSTETLVYRTATAGHLIGEVGFVDGLPHSATATAVTPTHVAVLERSRFTHMLINEPQVAAQLMAGLLRILAERMRHSNMTLKALTLVHAGLQEELVNLRKLVNV